MKQSPSITASNPSSRGITTSFRQPSLRHQRCNPRQVYSSELLLHQSLPEPSPSWSGPLAGEAIHAALLQRQGKPKPNDGSMPEEQGKGGEVERSLDTSFGYAKNLGAKFELGKEVGRVHFGHNCWAKGKKEELKGQSVAVKIISKAKSRCSLTLGQFGITSMIVLSLEFYVTSVFFGVKTRYELLSVTGSIMSVCQMTLLLLGNSEEKG